MNLRSRIQHGGLTCRIQHGKFMMENKDSRWIQDGGFKMDDSRWMIQDGRFKMEDSRWMIQGG